MVDLVLDLIVNECSPDRERQAASPLTSNIMNVNATASVRVIININVNVTVNEQTMAW